MDSSKDSDNEELMAETPGYVSNAKLAERISALVDRWNTREDQMIALLTQPQGAVTVTDGLGKDHVLPSFLQLSKDVSELVDELTGAVSGASEFANTARLYAEGAQASANDAQTSAEDAAQQLVDATGQAEASAASATASAASASASESSNQSAGLHDNAASASAADADADAIQAANSKAQAVASASAAASSEVQAAFYAHHAEDWSDQAKSWANAPSGTEIEPGAFSAKHWSEQARASLTGTLVYRGGWDAGTGSFPAGGNTGAFYKVTGGGAIGGRQYNPGDQIVHNGSGWDHIDNTEQVTSVAGKSGAVQLVPSDISGLGILATRDSVDFSSHVINKPASYPPSGHMHTKGDVGLSNVDNTSDANKPVSTAQQTSLDLKAPIDKPSFTGGVTVRNNFLRVSGWQSVPNDGVVYFGASDSWLFKQGDTFRFQVEGKFNAVLDSSGTVWTSGNFNPASKADIGGQPRFAGVFVGANNDQFFYTEDANQSVVLRFGYGTSFKYAKWNGVTGAFTAPHLIAGGSGNGAYVQIGDDVRLVDIGRSHTTAIQSTANGNVGFLQFGTGPTIGWDGATLQAAGQEIKHAGNTGYYGVSGRQHSDWNTCVTQGIWMAVGATNSPDNSDWWLGHVTVHNGDWVQQEVINFTSNPPKQFRRQKQGGSWGAWQQCGMVIVSTTDPGGADGVLWIQP
ncbi:pyocin knob domain-containing protein [Xanthomonas axonopodis]|uniref:pyocin knob domain-containing protein n=1 Tax=Xanthomonas axonopodis TaxID=53413 RepID=UPI0020C96C61|nr:pyocin knob domain-containing protein [Xanthomonas axonopodis]